MTLKQAFDSALKQLEAADTPSPRLSAELLLMFTLVARGLISSPIQSAN